MFPPSFAYLRVTNIRDALSLMRRYKDDAKVLAGGQSLIPMMKLRLATPHYVIDIGEIRGLSEIKEGKGAIHIGALTRHSEIEHSALLKKRLPIMAEAATKIGDQQVRNLGTLGGALCHADPAGDWTAVVMALDARFKLQSPRPRTVRAREFFMGPFETALKPLELMTGITVPIPQGANVGQAYVKFERKTGDFATVGVAAALTTGKNGDVQSLGLALCAVGPAPFEVNRAESILVGHQPTPGRIEDAASAAAEQSEPTSDMRGPAEYKKEMVKVFTGRALRLALQRAGHSN